MSPDTLFLYVVVGRLGRSYQYVIIVVLLTVVLYAFAPNSKTSPVLDADEPVYDDAIKQWQNLISKPSIKATVATQTTNSSTGFGSQRNQKWKSPNERSPLSLKVEGESDVRSYVPIPEAYQKYLPKKLRHNTCRINYGDRLIEYCQFCGDFDMSHVTIFIENYSELSKENAVLMNTHIESTSKCQLPNKAVCSLSQKLRANTSDAVLKVMQAFDPKKPLRYCFPQPIILFNLKEDEAVDAHGLTLYSEIQVNLRLSEKSQYMELCANMPNLLKLEDSKPSKVASERKGIAMFISNCNKKYNDRLIYLIKLMKHVRIDSYGRCLYNMRDKTGVFRPPPKKPDNWEEEFISIASKYRMVIAFEHILQPGLVSEKIFLIFQAGAIPIYRGALDVGLHLPGNNTVINVADYSSIEQLGRYLNRVLTSDDLFNTHTTLDFNHLQLLNKKHCGAKTKDDTIIACSICKQAYELKLASYGDGGRSCNCQSKPPPFI